VSKSPSFHHASVPLIPFRGFPVERPVDNHVFTLGLAKPKLNCLQAFFSSCLVDSRIICGLIPATGSTSWRSGFRFLAETGHFLFATAFRPALQPTKPLFNEYRESDRGVKWPECETGRLTTCYRGYDKPLLYDGKSKCFNYHEKIIISKYRSI
jgi:hypothetical protein